MPKTIDTFSANSLKVLDRSFEEFKNKYIYNLFLNKKDERAVLGQKFHNLICAYLKGFDVSKIILELDENEIEIWQKLKITLEEKKEYFIKTEYSFLIKEELRDNFYYLTGRFDAIYKENDEYIIYDWKTLNLPKNPEEDLQSIVYLYCSNKIFKTKKIKMRYLSIEKLDFIDVAFGNIGKYKERIDKIIEKIYFNIE